MTPTPVRGLIGAALATAALTWLALGFAYLSLPPLPWSAVPTLLLLSLGEFYTGLTLRPRIQRRPGTRPVEPLAVARMVVLAKASAWAAAVLVGVFGGFLAYVIPSLDKPTPRHDAFVAIGTLVAAVVLAAAALFLEHACRVPKGPGDDNGRQGSRRA